MIAGPIARYLELGLALGRHVDGLVDAYYGPLELRDRAESGPPAEPGRLVEEAERLLEDVRELELRRRRWLEAQLVGLHTVARRLGGEAISYSDEVELCYGIRPRRIPESEFAAAHERLDELLPRDGDLAVRYEAWLAGQTVERDLLAPALASLAEDFRTRARELFGLPAGEHADVELVSNEPWGAFNYYLGGLRSRVVVNTDLPVRSPTLAVLVAHELYPGHHTEHAWKEDILVRERGYLEETIQLVGTPQSLVSEGIAEVALEILLGDEGENVLAACLHPLGIPYDAGIAGEVSRARDVLGSITTNLALIVHEDGRGLGEACEYAMRWALMTRERAEKAVEFVTHPTWRAYAACYSEGAAVCRPHVAGDPERFKRLLTEQVIPANLVEADS